MSMEIHQLIHKMFDGVITPEEFAQLQAEMKRGSAVRELYYEYAAMEQRLQFRLGRHAAQAGVAGLSELRLIRQRKRTIKVASLTALAASILLAIGLSLLFIKDTPQQLEYAYAPGTKYELTHAEGTGEVDGPLMKMGSRMVVTQGTVELKFESGVRAVISAPADMTLLSGSVLQMPEGRAWFDVPREAIGFKVLTKEMEVVDLGTTFGVVSDPSSGDEVHVFQGKVRVSTLAGEKAIQELSVGEAVLANPRGELSKIEDQEGSFLTELPQALPHVHFSFDQEDEFMSDDTLTGVDDLSYQCHGARPQLREGVFGKALQLNGQDNFLETNWRGVMGDKPRSVLFWIRMPEARKGRDVEQGSHTIVGWGMQRSGSTMENKFNNKWTIHLDYSPNRYPMLNISFGGFWYYFPGVVLDDDQWHHVAVIYTGESDEKGLPVLKLYLDGVAVPITDSNVTSWEKLLDAQGRVMVKTLEKSPMSVGARLSREADESYHQEGFLRAGIDELYVVEGVVDEETVLSLMKQNTFPKRK
ncbi:hypothetical protein Rhal01_03240 [Rubritalea halochordaticola]|uniref:FecR protein domain-containing protein n=1 Tax=Rubritalea halochordaticola TaxID=714537 RepID=A0ABP9V322_9BACT